MPRHFLRLLVVVLLAAVLPGAPLLAGSPDAREYKVISPNGQITVTIRIDKGLTWAVNMAGRPILVPSPLSLTLADGTILGRMPKVIRRVISDHRQEIETVVPSKNRVIPDRYRRLEILFHGDWSLIVRAYDDGVAYRFETRRPGRITVSAEQAVFRFAGDWPVLFPTETGFVSHFERSYEMKRLSEIGAGTLGIVPTLVRPYGDWSALITEADLRDYPGLYLVGTGGLSLEARFPGVVKHVVPGRRPDRDEVVDARESWIAETDGRRSFPWRVLVLTREDRELPASEMVFRLAESCQLTDTTWIRPGKVAWDWWNANNLFGVNFRAGINTDTYKHTIDFAGRYGIEYVILDEGWSDTTDLLKVVPEMDIPELVRYGRQRNVGIILWTLWKPLDAQLDRILDQFAAWGVKGIKVDFMQRDDQWMVNYYRRVAEAAARRHLLVDFHGAYKPCGLRREWPNVLTREGVRGLEHCKWSDAITPEHDLILPFTRMVAGPMDFTPGAMVNAQPENFRAVFTRPMSMGTRCHQLAMYVVYESPLQMLCDSPSRYEREPACMEFLSAVPSVWDESRVLDARVGDFILVARRRGAEWFVGAMTDNTSRELTLACAFLGAGAWTADIWADGMNADRYGNDFRRDVRPVTALDTLVIRLAPGGGWVARIRRTDPEAVKGSGK